MHLYRTDYTDDQAEADGLNPRRSTWHGTQAGAHASCKVLHTLGMRGIVTSGVDVPTDKAGLLVWLNVNE